MLAVAVVPVLLAAGGVVYALTRGPSFPKQWDARVLPYVKVVEKERGLKFKHPIEVQLLSEKAFRKVLLGDDEGPSAEERKEIDQAAGMLRAVGLLQGKVDLYKAGQDLAGVGTLAYYDPEDETVRVRGKELTPAIRSTLVHELTHALQDQRFDIDSRSKRFEKKDDDGAQGYDALVEGDASRIETDYAESLSASKQAALEKSKEAEAKKYEDDKADADIPPILETFVGAPYALGEALLSLVVQQGGNDAVDDLFGSPPTSEEHLIDPWTLVADKEKKSSVDRPALEKGEKKVDSGTFGQMTWLLMLAERLPLTVALDASDGWGGDAYVSFERDDTTCVRIDYVGDTPQDADQLRAALTRWIAAGQGAPATVTGTGAAVTFESCDPGEAGPKGSNSSAKALQLALSRTYVATSVLEEGAPEKVARCFGDAVVHEYSITQLNDPTFGRDNKAVQARVTEMITACTG